MKIVAMFEDPIIGVRYGTIEVAEYNNNIQRRMDRFYNTRNRYKKIAHTKHIRQK